MIQNIKVLAINSASERGRKFPIEELVFDQDGIIGDVHAGTVRPVSLFDIAQATRFYDITGTSQLESGEFAENINFETPEKLDVKIFGRFVKDQLVL